MKKAFTFTMKKAFTILELAIAVTIGIVLFTLIYFWIGGMKDYTMEEMFWPEQTKARYQREMVEEMRRSNDIKENHQNGNTIR
jgi:hypothetical protein